MKILGISAHYHDSAAALIVDGVPVCAVQEERLSRRKNDGRKWPSSQRWFAATAPTMSAPPTAAVATSTILRLVHREARGAESTRSAGGSTMLTLC